MQRYLFATFILIQILFCCKNSYQVRYTANPEIGSKYYEVQDKLPALLLPVRRFVDGKEYPETETLFQRTVLNVAESGAFAGIYVIPEKMPEGPHFKVAISVYTSSLEATPWSYPKLIFHVVTFGILTALFPMEKTYVQRIAFTVTNYKGKVFEFENSGQGSTRHYYYCANCRENETAMTGEIFEENLAYLKRQLASRALELY